MAIIPWIECQVVTYFWHLVNVQMYAGAVVSVVHYDLTALRCVCKRAIGTWKVEQDKQLRRINHCFAQYTDQPDIWQW